MLGRCQPSYSTRCRVVESSKKSLMFLAVSTQITSVTDRQTDRQDCCSSILRLSLAYNVLRNNDSQYMISYSSIRAF